MVQGSVLGPTGMNLCMSVLNLTYRNVFLWTPFILHHGYILTVVIAHHFILLVNRIPEYQKRIAQNENSSNDCQFQGLNVSFSNHPMATVSLPPVFIISLMILTQGTWCMLWNFSQLPGLITPWYMIEKNCTQCHIAQIFSQCFVALESSLICIRSVTWLHFMQTIVKSFSLTHSAVVIGVFHSFRLIVCPDMTCEVDWALKASYLFSFSLLLFLLILHKGGNLTVQY